MIRLLEAVTEGGYRSGVGDVVNFSAVREAELVAAGRAVSLPLQLSCLWADRPSASSVPAGTSYRFIDVGGSAGSVWDATLAGWAPQNGSMVLASNWGTLAAPVATISGAASGIFVPSGGAGSLVIPASLLLETRAEIEVVSRIQKVGANATCDMRVYLGALGTASDPVVQNITLAITNNITARPACSAEFVEGSMLTTQGLGPGAQSATVGLQDKVVDLTVPNIISFGIATGNALDVYKLAGYRVTLKMI